MWKTSKYPLTAEWQTKCGIQPHDGIFFSLKNEGNCDMLTTWMKLEGIKLSEINQSHTHKNNPSNTV